MTPASLQALDGLRDLSTLKWYVIPLLAIVFYIYVECLLNLGGHLVWEYPWWNRSFAGVWLIFLFGYFHFYVAALLVIGMQTMRAKVMTVASLYGIAIVANAVAMGLLGWRY